MNLEGMQDYDQEVYIGLIIVIAMLIEYGVGSPNR